MHSSQPCPVTTAQVSIILSVLPVYYPKNPFPRAKVYFRLLNAAILFENRTAFDETIFCVCFCFSHLPGTASAKGTTIRQADGARLFTSMAGISVGKSTTT